MGGKKPVNATVEELEAAKTELKALIAKVAKAKADKEEIPEAVEKVQENVDELTDLLQKNALEAEEASKKVAADSKVHADGLYNSVRGEVLPMIEKLDSTQKSFEQSVEEVIQQVDSDLRNSFADELTSICGRFEEEFKTIREELTDLIELRAKEAADALLEKTTVIYPVIEEARSEAAARDAETRLISAEDLRVAKELQAEVDRLQDERLTQERRELNEELARIRTDLCILHDSAKGDTETSRQEAQEALDALQRATEASFLATTIRVNRLRDWLSEVEEVPTRRVEWLLPSASSLQRARTPASRGRGTALAVDTTRPAYTSYFSPKFNAAGGRDFQLELRVYSSAPEPPPSPSATGPISEKAGVGDCCVFLWCPSGMQLSLRFFVGEKWTTAEKAATVDYSSCGTKRMGWLKDHISQEQDNLCVGVEFLEAVRELNEQAAQLHDPLEDGAWEHTRNNGKDHLPYEGSHLTFHRHINHKVLPQVRKEVEKMQAKMIRRVEWLIKEADTLCDVFPNRAPICSPVFQAAGVEGMQFIFYPNGYRGAMDGFCSAFLFCPAGINLKCFLSAGKQRRDISNNFKEASAYGRVNFCRFDSAIDGDTNSLLMVLEIEEVMQEVKKVVRVVPDGSRLKSKKPAALELESAAPAPIVGSAVKLVRLADKQSLTEVSRLPALWTNMALGDMVKQVEGLRDFSELPATASMNRRRGGPPAVVSGREVPPVPLPQHHLVSKAVAPTSTFVKSESVPVLRLHDQSLDNSLPLICGPQGEWGSDQGHGSPLLWAGRPRKARAANQQRSTA